MSTVGPRRCPLFGRVIRKHIDVTPPGPDAVTQPTLKRKHLILLAGFVWMVMGIILVIIAVYFYRESPDALLLGMVLALIFGPLLNRLTVADLAIKNVERLKHLMPDKARLPLVEAQSRRNYVIILIMIVLGTVLRRTPIPREYVAPVYLVMGVALVLASREYFRGLRKVRQS